MRRSEKALYTGRLFLATVVFLLAAQAWADPNEGVVDRALRLSGVASQVKMLSHAILTAIPVETFSQPISEARLQSMLRKAFDEEAPLESVRRAIREDFDPGKIEQVVHFYSSKLGSRIGRLMGRALNPALLTAVRENRHIVKTLSAARLAAIEHIVRVERVTEFNIRLQTAVVRGLVEGRLQEHAESPGRRRKIRRNLAEAEKKIRSTEKRTWDTAMAAFAYTFRSLKDVELEEYISYLESDAASWFRTAVQRGMERAVLEASKAVGRITVEANPRQAPEQKSGRASRTPAGAADRE